MQDDIQKSIMLLRQVELFRDFDEDALTAMAVTGCACRRNPFNGAACVDVERLDQLGIGAQDMNLETVVRLEDKFRNLSRLIRLAILHVLEPCDTLCR